MSKACLASSTHTTCGILPGEEMALIGSSRSVIIANIFSRAANYVSRVVAKFSSKYTKCKINYTKIPQNA